MKFQIKQETSESNNLVRMSTSEFNLLLNRQHIRY